MKEIIIKHKLFEKCLLVYDDVIGAINNFKKEKSFGKFDS